MSVLAFPTLTPFGSASDTPLRVLNSHLSKRIAAVNHVRQRLKKFDVIVESQDLLRGGRAPLLKLFRGDMRIRCIAHAMRLNGDTWTASIEGVDVQWPASATTPVAITNH